LSHPPYKTLTSHSPNPLHGFFSAIGRALKFVLGGFIGWIYHHFLLHVGHAFTFAFGSWWPWAASVLTLALGATVAVLIYRRRSRTEKIRSEGSMALIAMLDPDEISRRAQEAFAAGHYENAVRLWFIAGVSRLTSMGFLANGEVRTDRQLLSSIPSPSFASLARRHEQIVYGRQRATVDDARRADEGWLLVMREVSRAAP
jgi:hypothetical protein